MFVNSITLYDLSTYYYSIWKIFLLFFVVPKHTCQIYRMFIKLTRNQIMFQVFHQQKSNLHFQKSWLRTNIILVNSKKYIRPCEKCVKKLPHKCNHLKDLRDWFDYENGNRTCSARGPIDVQKNYIQRLSDSNAASGNVPTQP